MIKTALAALALSFAVAGPAPLRAQEPPPAEAAEETTVEEVVVIARRTGVPVWRVDGPAGSLVLVGYVDDIPKSTPWNPDALADAVARADGVLITEQVRVNPLLLARAVLKARRMGLPRGRTLEDYLDPETVLRLRALASSGAAPEGWERRHPWRLASALIASATDTTAESANAYERVLGAARKHRKRISRASDRTARQIADSLLKSPPEDHLDCLRDAVAAAEAGPEANRRRAEAWTQGRVPAVLASAIDRTYGSCWPTGGPSLGAEYRRSWRTALQARLNSPGVTVAALPIRYLGETGGLLDGFEQQGLEIRGPRWR